MWGVKSKHQFRIRDASMDRQPKNLVIFSGGDSSKNYGADQQRLQISDLHFDKFPTPATLACWKIRFKTEVFTCSQFLTEAMHWIKEVEMVDSVDDLMYSVISWRNSNAKLWSTRCEDCFNTEQKSSIIPTSKEEWVWRNKRSRSSTVSFAEDRLLTWSMSTSGSQEPTLLSRTVPTYSLSVFEMTIFRNSIQSGTEFYCLWRKSRMMTSWKESEKLKTVLELYDLETHQKKLGPNYHRLKTMVKRSIEQDLRK